MANIFSNLFDFVKNGVSGINQIAYEMGLPEGESYGKSLLDKQKMELLKIQQQKEAAELVPAQFRAEILQKSRDNVTKAANGYSLPNGNFEKYLEFKKEKQSPYKLTQTLQPSVSPFNSNGQIDLSQQKLGKPQQPDPTSLLAQGSTLDPNSNIGKLFYGKTQVENMGNGVYHYIKPDWSQGEVDSTTGQRSNETKGISGFNISTILKNPTNSGHLYNVADIQNGVQFDSGTKDKINQLTQDYYNTFGEIPIISHDRNNGAFFASKSLDNKKQSWLKQKANSLGLTTGDLTDKGLSLIDSSVERNNQLNTNFSGDYVQGVNPQKEVTTNQGTNDIRQTVVSNALDSAKNGEQNGVNGCLRMVNKIYGASGLDSTGTEYVPTLLAKAQDKGDFFQDRNQLNQGDLVFYRDKDGEAGHIGIYIGNGKVVQSSSANGHTSTVSNMDDVGDVMGFANPYKDKISTTTVNQQQPNDYLQSVTNISQNFDSDNPASSIDNLRNNYLKYRNTGKIELGKLNNDALYTLQQWGVENPESIINSWNDDITKSNIGQLFNKSQQPNPDFQFSTLFKNGNLDLNAPNKTINIPGMGYENAMRQYGSVILNELLNDKASAGYYMNPQQQQQAAFIKNGLALSAEEQLQAQQEKQKTIIDVLNKIIGGLDSNTKTVGQYGADQQQTDQFERLLNTLGLTVGVNPDIHIKPAYGTKNTEIDISKFNALTGRQNAETNRANYLNNVKKTEVEIAKVSNQIEQTQSLKINDKIKLKQQWELFTKLASGQNAKDPITGEDIEGCHTAEDFTNLEAKYRNILTSIAGEGIPVAGTLKYFENGWGPQWRNNDK